ncbi:hypothetical protein WOLCODRAFT_15220 [Wolfiporia cocos MD-104 SS10]|uniref:Uncharacterized protein n=1 Tax=Wolfiporia cocos (strain MD-104) TaxID=742152 RepID=A0A2H3IX17_WOLCO|nr:hypothetical protein WOLCODRAFT_15220 [Wolfiporia cocos MD-104 SS10]
MSEVDEYDAYYTPLDLEDVFLSEAPGALRVHFPVQPESHPVQVLPSLSEIDEFELYDFSEFTAEDFARIDAALATPPGAATPPVPEHRTNRQHSRIGSGGPRIEISVEAATADRSAPLKDSSSFRNARSPFQQFRSWKKRFSVTDLVGPAWCEVQFDYGLRQRRDKKPEDRPDSFVTADGKTITSVHKVLEREIKPDEVVVDVTTPEEQWGLHLVNMLAAIDSLIERGLCREMPVFGFVHGEVVLGVIDELRRVSIPQPQPMLETLSSKQKSGENAREEELFPSQSKITSYFHMSAQAPESGTAYSTHFTTAQNPGIAPHPTHTLLLSDTKTRRNNSVPPDEDTVSSRLQLTIYHRLLSDLLALPGATASLHSSANVNPVSGSRAQARYTPQPPEFSAIWQRLELDPERPFSGSFVRDSGLLQYSNHLHSGARGEHSEDGENKDSRLWCLNDLTAMLVPAVEALNVAEVDRTLTLVYRMQPSKKQRKRATHQDGDGAAIHNGSSTPVSDQEAIDLAKAIEASLNAAAHPYEGGDDALSRAIAASLQDSVNGKETSSQNTDESMDLTQDMPGAFPDENITSDLSINIDNPRPNRQYVQEPLSVPDVVASEAVNPEAEPASLSAVSGDSGSEEKLMTVAELDVQAHIIGRKEFVVDDDFLDGYLDNILDWWHGRRPPRGVDVELTRRCIRRNERLNSRLGYTDWGRAAAIYR